MPVRQSAFLFSADLSPSPLGLVLGGHKPDRPYRGIGRCHQLGPRIKHLLELGAGIAVKGIMLNYQKSCLVLQFGQLLSQVLIGGDHGAHLHKGPNDLGIDGDGARAVQN